MPDHKGIARELNQQQKATNAKAKYGKTGKPALVVVKRLDGTQDVTVDQSTLTEASEQTHRRIAKRTAIRNSQEQRRGRR